MLQIKSFDYHALFLIVHKGETAFFIQFENSVIQTLKNTDKQ